MRSNLFEKNYDFMTRETRKSVRWTVFGYALARRARQYPGTSSAIVRIVSVLHQFGSIYLLTPHHKMKYDKLRFGKSQLVL